jgi:integrase
VRHRLYGRFVGSLTIRWAGKSGRRDISHLPDSASLERVLGCPAGLTAPGLVQAWSSRPAMEPRNFSRSFDRCIVKAQVPRITVHGTRKTCGSLLAALDVHPRVAMQILRHSKIAVTMEIYTEVPSAATRDALKRLGQWLGG